MRYQKWLLLAASTGFLLAASGASFAQQTKGLFTNDQVTLACQNYINTLYPPGAGATDNTRQSLFISCLRRHNVKPPKK